MGANLLHEKNPSPSVVSRSAIALVDRWGRRTLLLEGAAQMMVTLSAMAVIMGLTMDPNTGSMADAWALVALIVICV